MHQDGDFPTRDYFAALHPDFADVVDHKMKRELAPLGDLAGGLTEEAASWTGLPPGTPVAIANVDAHVTLPTTGTVDPGTMVMIMGTSTCNVLVGHDLHEVEGMCGTVLGGIVPGQYGYEAGQSGVGDIFAWFVEHAVPPYAHDAARQTGLDLHRYLAREAARQHPGEHGLLALDWWNGNRSILVDAELGGLLIGMTLGTRPEDIYRALLEATAYGQRVIIDAFENRGIPVTQLVAAGGLPRKNPLLMQIYADVLNRDIHLVASDQAPALGAAMHAAVAAGAYPDIAAAAERMGRLSNDTYHPNPEHARAYDALYRDYLHLHDLLGRSGRDQPAGIMKRLRERRARARQAEGRDPA
jgi:L-ribulokinase